MKNKLLLSVAALSLACSNVQAGHFLVEKDDDIDRVYNNVKSFWSQHQNECRVFSKIFSSKTEIAEEDGIVFKNSLQNIAKSTDELADEIRSNPQLAIQDIDETLRKIRANPENKKASLLKNGLALIRQVIFSLN